MKQFIRMKRARFGLKLYELCESTTGYISNSIVHLGNVEVMNLDPSTDGWTSSCIVLTHLCERLHVGHCIFLNNLYSSPTLYIPLQDRETEAVGTVRTNRHGMTPSFQ